MSWTVESQLLNDRVCTAIEALDEVSQAMRERIDDYGEWSDDHRKELGVTLTTLAALRLDLALNYKGQTA